MHGAGWYGHRTGDASGAICDGAGVAITPGRDFGDVDAHKYVRLTYTIDIVQLKEVVARLKAFLKK